MICLKSKTPILLIKQGSSNINITTLINMRLLFIANQTYFAINSISSTSDNRTSLVLLLDAIAVSDLIRLTSKRAELRVNFFQSTICN